MSRETKMVVDQLIEDLRNRPEDFSCGLTLYDKKTNVRYWACSGIPFYGIYQPYSLRFGLIQGFRFGRALKKWKAADCIRKAKGAP